MGNYIKRDTFKIAKMDIANRTLAANIIAGAFTVHAITQILANFSILFFIVNLKILVLYLFLTLFVISFLIDNSIISKNLKNVVVFALCMSLVYLFAYAYSGYKTPGGALVVLISGSIFLALRKDIQQKCILWVINAFAILFLLSLVEYIVDVLTGKRFVVAHVMRPSSNASGFQFFEETLFNVLRTETGMPRFQSLTEEPGLIGTLCAFLLFVTGNDPKYRKQFFVFLTSMVLSFSLGGYVITFFYIVFLRIKSIKNMLFVVAMFICMALFFGAFFNQLIFERLQSNDVDNRTNEQFDRLFRHAFETGELWLGKGDIGYRARVEGKNAGGKVWWYHYGITSFFVVFFCYNYIYVSLCKRRRMSYGQFIFLLAFWVSFYQRSDITEPHYLLPFVGAAILLSKNDVKSLKLEKREVK